MSRKPRVSPLVPTRAIDRYLAGVHVATPDERIVAEIKSAPGLSTDARWTPALLRQTIRYALWRHEQNYLEFARVVAGH